MDIRKLQPPEHPVDVVLDTDAYNEIDDQFAIAYLLRSSDRLHTKALYAAPFFNSNAASPADGMERSYQEILHLLQLMKLEGQVPVFRGSENYLPDETTPVVSAAAQDLARRAMNYTAEAPLYVVAIGAITNVASALLLNPAIADRIVIVWLGGHSLHWDHTKEFNMKQDVAAARVVFNCSAPLVQLPCMGVVSEFRLSEPELRHWLLGKNELCTYLAQHAIDAVTYAVGKPWTRIIWDVTAVAWLLGGFTRDRILPRPIPEYDNTYTIDQSRPLFCYVNHIRRDALADDLIRKLLQEKEF